MSENEASKELDAETTAAATNLPRRPNPFIATFDAPARPRPQADTDDEIDTTRTTARAAARQADVSQRPTERAASTPSTDSAEFSASKDASEKDASETAESAAEDTSPRESTADASLPGNGDTPPNAAMPTGNTDSASGDPTNNDQTTAAAHAANEAPPGGFGALLLKPELLKALATLGYEEPTPIQRQAIPQLLQGVDLLGQAATGTGKTAAFALPILNNIDRNDAAIPLALVVVPTRELAVQVSEAFFKYGRESRVKVLPVFGGQPIGRQLDALRRGVHVVVGTPGRVIDHIKRGSLDLEAVQTVVLDEADEMLDMGFTDDIESILQATPDSRQTVLFSATMPKRIEKLAKKYQRNPVSVKISKSKGDEANPLIRQTVYMVLRAHKASALGRILDIESPESAIVFCRTRHEVDELTVTMNGRGYRAEALHGGMDQQQRDRVMARLRDGTAELLVATDVAARGLDVDTLTHVVNYDVPSAPESYVHRIGRVGRAGREGVAITIAEPRQRRLLGNIERLTKQTFDIAKVPSVADLRTKQIEMTVSSVRDALADDDLGDYQSVLDALSEDHSDQAIALAAIKLVHRARGATIDDREIPDASAWKKGKGPKGKGPKFDRDKQGKGKSARSKGGAFEKGRKGKSFDGKKGYLHVSIGRDSGVRPGDLVGAIANEGGLSGSDIGPIKIQDHYAVVGVPESEVENIVRAMKKTTIRGNPAKLRRYKD